MTANQTGIDRTGRVNYLFIYFHSMTPSLSTVLRLRLFPPEQRRFDHRRLSCLPRAKNSVTVHGCKGVGERRDIRRLPGECRSALKSVEYAPRELFKSSATTLSHPNLGQSLSRFCWGLLRSRLLWVRISGLLPVRLALLQLRWVSKRRQFWRLPPSRSSDVISAVQSALTKRGYYRGPIDGIIGPDSRRANPRLP